MYYQCTIFSNNSLPVHSPTVFRECVDAYKWAKGATKYGDDVIVISDTSGFSRMVGQIDSFAERYFYEEEVD
jgi:hypothetical protein